MSNKKSMNWGDFKSALLQNPGLDLQFQYAENKWVDASYHITEIKQSQITAVDCGGVMNKWTEIIVQLYEPAGGEQDRAMKVDKALAIIGVVEKIVPLEAGATVKIEFGNSEFDTRQMYPNEITVNDGNLIIDLRPDTVQCKAIERGGSCGTTVTGDECCTPAAQKPKIKLSNIAVAAGASCTPGSGCC